MAKPRPARDAQILSKMQADYRQRWNELFNESVTLYDQARNAALTRPLDQRELQELRGKWEQLLAFAVHVGPGPYLFGQRLEPATLQFYLRLVVSMAMLLGFPPSRPDLTLGREEHAVLASRAKQVGTTMPRTIAREVVPSAQLQEWTVALQRACAAYKQLILAGKTHFDEGHGFLAGCWRDLAEKSVLLDRSGAVGGVPVSEDVLVLYVRMLAYLASELGYTSSPVVVSMQGDEELYFLMSLARPWMNAVIEPYRG